MMLHYLLDTNVISESCKPSPHPNVLVRIEHHQGEMAISAHIWHELLFGVYRLPASTRRTQLEEFLQQVAFRLPILPYDDRAAQWHAEQRARLYQRTPARFDVMIAAVAAANGLVLVTRNVSDYADFIGLKMENWMA